MIWYHKAFCLKINDFTESIFTFCYQLSIMNISKKPEQGGFSGFPITILLVWKSTKPRLTSKSALFKISWRMLKVISQLSPLGSYLLVLIFTTNKSFPMSYFITPYLKGYEEYDKSELKFQLFTCAWWAALTLANCNKVGSLLFWNFYPYEDKMNFKKFFH